MQSSGAVVLRADLRGVAEEAYLTSELFIGTKVLPPLPVTARAGQYPYISITSGALLRNEAKPRGPGAAYARLQRKFITDNYTTEEYGLEVPVDDSQSADISRFFDLESTETRLALRQIQLAHEIRVAATVINTAVFGITTSAVSYGSGPASLANMDIGFDVDAAKAAIQGRGESSAGLTLVMSLNVFNRARTSTKLQNRIRGTVSTDTLLILDTAALAQALGVDQVLVGRVYYDTSKTGAAAAVMTAIWGDAYMWLGHSMSGGGSEQYFNGSTGFTLYWNDDAAFFQMESYREEEIRSTIIRGRQHVTEKIIIPRSAQLIDTQYGA